LNPLQPGFHDGTDIDPFEIMFIKVKRSMREARWRHTEKAVAVSEWIRSIRIMDVGDGLWNSSASALIAASQRNAWLEAGGVQAAEAEALRRGAACFDWKFYLEANHYDLGHYLIETDSAPNLAWAQFLDMGLYEGRPHRWTC